MPEIQGIEKLVSFSPSKRCGKHREYGRGMYGFSVYGEEDEFIESSNGEKIYTTGIFRRDNVTGEVKYYREPYYIPKNPRTETQQANRQKLADGVLAWQSLTPEQKNQYNKNAIGKGMSGYNLFLHNYLLSN